ncbi:cupredoxin domain-containing protein [Chengkuizengella axinellae]|uniref:Cupredoxin domain-containing protein n=1 Tax=Chengkuizengella axinellae TaxID=3064388 RepID=A0ABT9J4S6_9BACL|nr:cupredoxin domain-containing protein [Chengkuizengella sp. 2205SS18-9]MDP5276594.1 cupredoxin domain-containing protein [Chengkuizengella sp. 2205SS18-9]
MKKMLFLVTLLAMALTVAACGAAEENTSNAAVETSAADAKELKLIASNWVFDQEEYKVAVGEPIHFSIENAEGLHAFKIKDLGIEVDQSSPKQFTINEPGTYEIKCSIQCGSGHRDMISTLVVE